MRANPRRPPRNNAPLTPATRSRRHPNAARGGTGLLLRVPAPFLAQTALELLLFPDILGGMGELIYRVAVIVVAVLPVALIAAVLFRPF